jgi:integrase
VTGQAGVRRVVRYRIRYRDPDGRAHSETFPRRDDAERRRTEIEAALVSATWLDPRRGEITLADWARDWLPTRHDLRATTWARLETTMERQVLPRFGSTPLRRITNGEVRGWVRDLIAQGLSAATVRKAVFALRQCLAAAVADGRLTTNPADAVPLPTERPRPARYLSQTEVERLVAAMPRRYQALVLVGAYAGLRWGEATGLRRRDVDPLRSRIRVTGTAVQIRGVVTLDNEPKTTRSRRTIPVARSVMARIEQHLDEFIGVRADDLVFTAPTGGPLFRAFTQTVLRPAVQRAGLDDITFHGLRHSFVAILVAAGCNVREVSEWAATTASPSPSPGTAVSSRTAPMPPSTASTPSSRSRGQSRLPHRRRPSGAGPHHLNRLVCDRRSRRGAHRVLAFSHRGGWGTNRSTRMTSEQVLDRQGYVTPCP